MVLSFKSQFKKPIIDGTKIHTIREDKRNRWKSGNEIHFTENDNCFNIGKCISTQRISIYKVANVYTPYTYKTKGNKTFQIAIDGKCLNVR